LAELCSIAVFALRNGNDSTQGQPQGHSCALRGSKTTVKYEQTIHYIMN